METSPSSMMRKPSRLKLSTCSSLTSSNAVRCGMVVATPVRYPRMEELSKQPLDAFLESVAEATPAPGGGSSAAVAAALAAALVEMAARLAGSDAAPSSRAADAPPSNRAADHAGALRARALRLAHEEMSSYAPVLGARDERERELAL